MAENAVEVTVTAGPPGLAQKLIAVGGEIGYIQKDATNPHHKYHYASEKAIKEAVYPKLREHGVLFHLEITGEPCIMDKALIVPMRWTFTDAASGEIITGLWAGSGRAGDDKGLYIAVTGAIKYALTTIKGIVTGDDPEMDMPVPETKAKPPVKKPATRDEVLGVKEPQPAEEEPVKDSEGMLACGVCEETFPETAVKAKFPAKFPDRGGRWDTGELLFYCPKCEKTVDSFERARERAAEGF